MSSQNASVAASTVLVVMGSCSTSSRPVAGLGSAWKLRRYADLQRVALEHFFLRAMKKR